MVGKPRKPTFEGFIDAIAAKDAILASMRRERLQEGDFTANALAEELGLTDSGARDKLDKLARLGKLIKMLGVTDAGRTIMIYRPVLKGKKRRA